MKNIRMCKKKWIPVWLFVLFMNVFSVKAMENDDIQKHQMIFALDCSYSVSDERWEDAIDCIAMISAMLPSNYETAILAYNEEIVFSAGFEQSLADKLSDLEDVKRKGYTNTGLVVDTALEQFSEELSGEKRIVIISDGEISMKGNEETESAIVRYDAAVRNAVEKNVKIDVLLFETQKIEEQISYGTQLSGGSTLVKADEKTIGEFLESYLFEELNLERIMLGTSDASENISAISLQNAFAESVKVLLLAENDIDSLQISCQCKDVKVTQGQTFAVIYLDHPMEEDVNLQYTVEEGGKINAYLTKEYYFTVEMDAVYDEQLLTHMIKVRILDSKGESILVDEEICEKVDIYVNENKKDFTLEQGTALISHSIDKNQEIIVRVDFDGLNSEIFCESTEKKLLLELPPPEPVEPDNTPYIWLGVVVISVCVIFVVLVFLLLRSKKKTGISAENTVQNIGEVLKYDFSGEMVIYVLKGVGGEDVPPASINLYKHESKEPFSFAWVKDKCKIEGKLRDADKITFSGGKNNTLCVRNNGDVSLFVGNNLLLRNKKYTLNYNEKILAIFNDGEVELEIYYKNIKPSERQR